MQQRTDANGEGFWVCICEKCNREIPPTHMAYRIYDTPEPALDDFYQYWTYCKTCWEANGERNWV
jgi:hypothetical protein